MYDQYCFDELWAKIKVVIEKSDDNNDENRSNARDNELLIVFTHFDPFFSTTQDDQLRVREEGRKEGHQGHGLRDPERGRGPW